jgi:hypothetical protein
MDEYRPVKAERNRRQRFKERARLEYLAAAEEDWRKRTGRPMTAEELSGCCAGIRGTSRLGP